MRLVSVFLFLGGIALARLGPLVLEGGSRSCSARCRPRHRPDQDNSFLGAPRLTRDHTVTPPVWPASFVIVHVPDRARYEARDLQTGRVLASGSIERAHTASIGNVLVRYAGAHVRSAGERLVISVGQDDDRRSYVVSASQ